METTELTAELTGPMELQNALLKQERKFLDSAVDMMHALTEIRDSELYRARGFEDMKTYLRVHIAKTTPFALSYSQSLLALSQKVSEDVTLRTLDANRLVELGRIANETDVLTITDEFVTLSDGTRIGIDEFKNQIKKDVKKEMAKKQTKEEKNLIQELQDKLNDSERLVKTLQSSLDEKKIEEELANNLGFIKTADLSKFLSLTGARKMFFDEGQLVEQSLLIFVNSINKIEEKIKAEEEIQMAVQDFVRSLDSAKQRIANIWNPFIKYENLAPTVETLAIEDRTLAAKDEIQNLLGYLDNTQESDWNVETIYSKTEDIEIALNLLDESDPTESEREFSMNVRACIKDLNSDNLQILREVIRG